MTSLSSCHSSYRLGFGKKLLKVNTLIAKRGLLLEREDFLLKKMWRIYLEIDRNFCIVSNKVGYLFICFTERFRRRCLVQENWNTKEFSVILLASLIPFGTFYIDWKYFNLSQECWFVNLPLEILHKHYHHYLHQCRLRLITIYLQL